MNTPILDALIAEYTAVPEVCGSTGPRIGEDGQPRCAQPLDHIGPHLGFEGSGFESVGWDGPLWRDVEFAEYYRKYLAQQRQRVLDFL